MQSTAIDCHLEVFDETLMGAGDSRLNFGLLIINNYFFLRMDFGTSGRGSDTKPFRFGI